MGDGLFEVRSTLPSRTIARVFVCHHGGVLFALHAMIKKTAATPDDDLVIAHRRKKEINADDQ